MTTERTLYVNWIQRTLHVSTLNTAQGFRDNTIHEPAHETTTVIFRPGTGVRKVNEVVVRDRNNVLQSWGGTASGYNYQITDPGTPGTFYYCLNANVGNNAKTLDPRWEHD